MSDQAKPEAKSFNPKPIIFSLLALGALGLLAWRLMQEHRDKTSVSGTLEAAEVYFGSRQAGRVKQVLVKEGENLEAGQIILTLDAPELYAQRDNINATIEAQKALLEELRNGTRPQQIQAAQQNYQAAKADYAQSQNGYRQEDKAKAEAELERLQALKERSASALARRKALFADQLVSRDNLEEYETNAKNAQAQFEAGQAQLDLLQSGYRPEEQQKAQSQMLSQAANYQDLANGTRPERLKAEEAKLAALSAQLAEIESRLEELNVRSSCACLLTEFEIEPGSLLNAGQITGLLIDLSDTWIDIYLPIERYSKLQVGDKLKLTSISYPNQDFMGQVRFIAKKAEFTPRNIQTIEGRRQQVFKVKVAVKNTSKARLLPGTDFEVHFPS